MKPKQPQPAKVTKPVDEIDVNLTAVEIEISYGDAADAASALAFMSERLNPPQFEIEVKIGTCRRALKPLTEDFSSFSNRLALEHAIRDEDGEVIRNEEGGFRLKATEYNLAIGEQRSKTAKVNLPLWTYDELRWMHGVVIGKSADSDGMAVAAEMLTKLSAIIRDQ